MAEATDYKISSAEVQAVQVKSKPTVLQGSATQNKDAFDQYPDKIVEKHNGLCDFLETNLSAQVDEDVLQLFLNDGWVPDN